MRVGAGGPIPMYGALVSGSSPVELGRGNPVGLRFQIPGGVSSANRREQRNCAGPGPFGVLCMGGLGGDLQVRGVGGRHSCPIAIIENGSHPRGELQVGSCPNLL